MFVYPKIHLPRVSDYRGNLKYQFSISLVPSFNLSVTTKHFKKMDQIVANPGYSHIAEKIFFELDQESLTSCQNVNHSWKLFLEDPIFWLNKMKKSSSILYTQWKELIQKTLIR